MSLRTPYLIRILFDLIVTVVSVALFVGIGLAIAAHYSDAMSERFKPFHGIVCRTLDPQPGVSSTRMADLTGDWKGLGAKSLGGAVIDAFHNEAWSFCRNQDDPARAAFLNAADKRASKARKALRGAPQPGLRTEEDLFKIESAQIAAQKPENQMLARWAIAEANQLLARPERDIVADIREQSGINAATDQADSFAREIANTGLLDVLGGNELISRIENEIGSNVDAALPPKILLTRTAMTEPTPTLEITRTKTGAIIGVPLTVIGKDMAGTYKASRVWLTMEAEPSGQSWTLKRWLTRPL